MRTIVLVLAAVLLAFAPAPLPRRERGSDGSDDLKKLQGDWSRVRYRGRADTQNLTLRVSGGRIQFLGVSEEGWAITLDATKRPKRIDLVKVGDPTENYRGVYRLEGDSFTYCIKDNVSEADRPLDVDGTVSGSWVAVFVRPQR